MEANKTEKYRGISDVRHDVHNSHDVCGVHDANLRRKHNPTIKEQKKTQELPLEISSQLSPLFSKSVITLRKPFLRLSSFEFVFYCITSLAKNQDGADITH